LTLVLASDIILTYSLYMAERFVRPVDFYNQVQHEQQKPLSRRMRRFLREQELISRALIMADSILEVFPDVDPQEAFNQSLDQITDPSKKGLKRQ